MSENKTKLNDQSVIAFLESGENPKRKDDAFQLLEFMKKVTGMEPKMWGNSLIGFGSYHYKYTSGREGDWFLTGFSPRKQNMTVYIMPGFTKYGELLEKIGKYKTGKGCLYFNKLEDINLGVLETLVVESVNFLKEKYS